jgi:hypothetical protein
MEARFSLFFSGTSQGLGYSSINQIFNDLEYEGNILIDHKELLGFSSYFQHGIINGMSKMPLPVCSNFSQGFFSLISDGLVGVGLH